MYSSTLRVEPINGEYRIMDNGDIILDHLTLALASEILYAMQQYEQEVWDAGYWVGWDRGLKDRSDDDE